MCPAQYSDFRQQVKRGHVKEITLVGHGRSGFFLSGRIETPHSATFCVLVNQRSGVRFMKCLDSAHSVLYNLGVNQFKIDTTSWDMASAFNPHKSSYDSRQRKKHRDEG